MSDTDLVERLAALPSLAGIPRTELEWLATHGSVDVCETGERLAPKGLRIEHLWIMLSGHVAISVDRGTGPRIAMEWRSGDIGGMLPYSRMKGPPGDNIVMERSEIYLLHERLFQELIQSCPLFTANTVHTMLDRARSFNTSDQQDEKMISLGKLAAGLAHELNNPASATVRGAKLLLSGLAEADAASRALGAAGLTPAQAEAIERTRSACAAKPAGNVLSPLDQADREDVFTDWLARHNADPRHAAPLAETSVTIEALDGLAAAISGDTLEAALRWISAGCTTHSLAVDIERAANRIYGLVAAVKKFTYMDNLAGRESVDVEAGIRDTMRILSSKTRSRGASLTLDVEPGLPLVTANGGELNQVWLNLIDNALDAIPESGHVAIDARRELDRVVVRIVDDGPGIPPEVLPRIFDPFFTTKPPGQGTGLGLDITRRLLRHYYGDVDIQSRPGRTECRVRLVVEKPSVKGDGPSAENR
jgi:signal transduction histidine kinase